MIDYGKDAMCDTYHLMGSIFPRAFPQALVSGLIALAAISISENTDVPELQRSSSLSSSSDRETIVELITHPYVHQVSMLSISFVLAFRVSLAYNRYWEGISMVHSMRSKWIDAVSQLVVFDTPQPAAKNEKPEAFASREADSRAFRAQLGHLFSLLHAVSILEIKRCWRTECLLENAEAEPPTWRQTVTSMFPNTRAMLMGEERRALALRVTVLGGLQDEEAKQLQAMGANAWAEVTALRVLHCVVDRMRNGGLQIAAPILSRVFQEISTGTLMCTSAQKISQIPFPYPFYELMRWVKWYFLISCPLVIVSFTRFWSIAIGASFLSSLLVISLNEVAEELEDPFGEDANDLPLLTIHREFNAVLHRMVSQPKLQIDTRGTPSHTSFIGSIYDDLLVQHRRTMSIELGQGDAAASGFARASQAQKLPRPNIKLQPMQVRT